MMTSKPQKKYKVRAGTIDSGKKYEYKIAALLSLRCVLHNEDVWILSNADGVGAFDDVIVRQGNKTFMLQLKHKDDPKPLLEREFSARKGDFILKKYLDDIKKLKEPSGKQPDVINYLSNFEDIHFVLFTNRPTNTCKFLEESSDIPSFLNTDTKEHKVIVDKVPDIPNADYADLNVYLLSSQVHAKYIDLKISDEIQKVADNFKIKHLFNKQITMMFIKYVADWAEGTLGGHYCLTKFDIIGKLTELFYSQYEIKLSSDILSFRSSNKRQIWNDIIRDKTLTLIDFEENILKFVFKYIGQAVSKYSEDCRTWNEMFSTTSQNTFYGQHPNLKIDMLKIVGNHGKITPSDVYKCLWMSQELPLLLEINNSQQYDDILHILKLSNYYYHIIIIKNCKEDLRSLTDKNIQGFMTLRDVEEEKRKQILAQNVKLQGRSSVTLAALTEEDMLHYIKCKDIINILLDNFNIGNNLNPLPEYFISRSISKVFLLVKVVDIVQDEIFLIENPTENSLESIKQSNIYQVEDINENKLNRGGIVCSTGIPTHQEIEKLKSTKRPVHHLTIHSENYLEWKASFGSVENLRPFEVKLEDITESCILNKSGSPINIINAVPGMGKSILMDYIALQIPTNKWVLKIDLNGHRRYYKTNACKSSSTKALEHLEYFKNSLLNQQNDLIQLSNAVFKKLSETKDVILLLDGFDEISVSHKTEVTNIAKSLHNEGYSVWLTTRPYMTSHLEREFETFSISLTSFSVHNQKEFLTKYFHTENAISNTNSKKLIESFVEKLLKAAEKNLNDWDAEFTGIPLQTKLLADAFRTDCMKYIATNGNYNFNENFDLLYLYQTFIDKKIDILCDKFGASAEDNRTIIKDHQSCFALKLLFFQHANLLLFQHVTEEFNTYYKNKPDRVEILQREGVVIVDSNFNVNFIHRTYGEYLAALWLAENLRSMDEKGELAKILIKNRFTRDYKFLFGLFDRILSKDCPLHLAIINNKNDEILKILNSKSETVAYPDAGGRSILHILALYSPQFPQLFEEFRQSYLVSHKALKYLDSSTFNTDYTEIINKIIACVVNYTATDLLGYNALDYALANNSLTFAHNILNQCRLFTINANINFKLKKNYLMYCALLDYNSLFNFLLPHFISKDLLLANVDKNDLIETYVKNLFRFSNFDNKFLKTKLNNFEINCIEQYKNITLIQLFQPMDEIKWKWSNAEYSDIRYAVCFGSNANVNKLLTNGIKANQEDGEYNTLLHYAVLHKNIDAVNMILSKYPETDVNKQNFQMNTPLHLAFANMTDENSLKSFFTNSKRNNIVKKLITLKACTNVKNYDSVTPLHLAIENRKNDWVKLFLSNDGDVNVQDEKGNNSIHLAAMNNYNDILNIILNKGRAMKIDIPNNEGETPLFCTIRNNNINTMKLLLDKDADVNVQNIYGETILHIISTNGYNELLTEILNLAKISDINIKDNYGWTPFSSALFNNNIETTKILIDNDANLDILNHKGKTLFEFAIKSGHKNLLSTVLVNGSNIDINRQDKYGRTPLFNAVKNGDLDKVLQLLRLEAKVHIQDNKGLTVFHLFAGDTGIEFNDTIFQILNKNFTKIDGNIQDCNGRTPLYYAIQNNKKSATKLFLAHGADVHIRDRKGISSLHLIASRGYNNILSEILADNVNINIQDNDGRTPLYYAIQENNRNTVDLLFKHHANFNVQDKNGTSPLHLIASRGYKDILVSKSPNMNLNIQDNEGRTPLYCAIQENDELMAIKFIDEGADFNIKDNDGISSLHLIANKGYYNLLQVLLNKHTKINLNVQDNSGRTIIFQAALNNHEKTIKILLQHGADVNIPDNEGRTAANVATNHACKAILQ